MLVQTSREAKVSWESATCAEDAMGAVVLMEVIIEVEAAVRLA